MNIAEVSIRKKVITLVLTFLLVVGGIHSYNQLSRLEDPEFTIKDAVVYTPYPGASAAEVEKEVSNVIEKAVQELGQLDLVESKSQRDFSTVIVTIKDKYNKKTLPQVWNELRRKIHDYQNQLPPGAGPSLVNDDYGDVYGVFFAITGEGYTYADLKDVADFLRRELLLVQDVKRIIFYGEQPETIYVEMARDKMARLGISQNDIYKALADKNLAISSGWLTIGEEYIPINPSGEFKSEKQFGDLMVRAIGSDKLIHLKDVAKIKRGYLDPSRNILRFNGKPAVALGISTVLGGNVVTMGESLDKRGKELEKQIPLGIEIHIINLQSDDVVKAVNGFLVNLIEAIVIVVVILLIFMGIRSGLIIGAILLITICGTFIFMNAYNIILQRISLGALIIALGMLVDNAIVVTDGMKVRIEQGVDRVKAASDVVGQTAIPLLGATAVAITAFAAIGVSKDSTGEYCSSLFQVIFISLLMSWATAVTITPLFCKMFLKGPAQGRLGKTKKPKDPYAGKIFRLYRRGLENCIRLRWAVIGVVAALFFIALFGFGFVPRSFFPSSTKPQFLVDVWLPEGTHINDTTEELEKAEKYLIGLDGVEGVALAVGGGNIRYMLTYSPEYSSYSYGQFIVNVKEYRMIDNMTEQVQEHLSKILPNATIGTKKMLLGPGDGGKIQLRISGPDRDTIRKLARKAKDIMREDGGARTIRDEWREKEKVVRPQLSEAQARRTGISRPQLSKALEQGFSGLQTGVYREEIDLIPILARAPEAERKDVDSMQDLQVWSPALQRTVPIRQVVSDFKTAYEDANIWRRDRTTMLRIHCDPKKGLSSELLARIKPKIEQALNVDVGEVLGKKFGPGQNPFANFNAQTLPIKYKAQWPLKDMPGYSMGWDGQAEDSANANANLAQNLPKFAILMVLIVIFLFNAILQPLIIWLCVPLAIIGVTAGLLLTRQPFGFMALLGLLSLSGMLIKNAVVLIDQIECDKRSGKELYLAIVDSGVSRLRPVTMAALTTILGMAPLLTDGFFVAMAVTIMFGLTFATVLTLILVPVLYSIFFRVPIPVPVPVKTASKPRK